MTANGIAQIVLYVVILTALAYPLGIYMARVYEGTFGFVNGRLATGERAFLRLVRSSPDHEQNWKSYAGSVVTVAHSAVSAMPKRISLSCMLPPLCCELEAMFTPESRSTCEPCCSAG